MSWQRVYEILLKATVLAVILTIPPIVGLFLIWQYGERTALSIVVWTICAVFWNIVVLILVVKGKLFKIRDNKDCSVRSRFQYYSASFSLYDYCLCPLYAWP